MVWSYTNFDFLMVAGAKLEDTALIGRSGMTDQSRARRGDAEVPQISCRIIREKAHGNTKSEEGTRRVQTGAIQEQQEEGVDGVLSQKTKPLILEPGSGEQPRVIENDLSQCSKELGSYEQPRVCKVT